MFDSGALFLRMGISVEPLKVNGEVKKFQEREEGRKGGREEWIHILNLERMHCTDDTRNEHHLPPDLSIQKMIRPEVK